MGFGTLMRKPSALLPVALSAAALTLVLSHVLIFGVVREADEGIAAHIWQLLMVGQAPIIAWFVAKWLPRAPRKAVWVLAFQVAAALAALAPVFLLGL